MRQSVPTIFVTHLESLGHTQGVPKGSKIQAIQFLHANFGAWRCVFPEGLSENLRDRKRGLCGFIGLFFFPHSPPRSDGCIRVRPGLKPARFGFEREALKGNRRTNCGFPRRESWGCGRAPIDGPDRPIGARGSESNGLQCDLRIWGARSWTTKWRERC